MFVVLTPDSIHSSHLSARGCPKWTAKIILFSIKHYLYVIFFVKTFVIFFFFWEISSLTWNCFPETKCQSIIFSHWFQLMSLKESVLREWYFSVILTKKYHRSIMEVSSDHVAIAFLSCGFVLWMFWAHSGQYSCPLGATCLPNMGNVLAPLGHAACPFREELYRTAMSLVISKHYAGMNKKTWQSNIFAVRSLSIPMNTAS